MWQMRVAVVGAGVNGLAAAAAIARRGHADEVHEQFALDHVRGSSHGRSRIFRLAYPDPEWVALAREAFDGWRELERETGEQLLVLDELLELGATSEAALAASAIRWEPVEREDAEARFGVRADGPVVHQPDAGAVLADRALHAFAHIAVAHGARIHTHAPVASLAALDADVVVVAAGAWAQRLLEAEAIPLPVKVTRETVCYFRCAARVPSVIEWGYEGSAAAYAVVDPAYGLKAGIHHAGAEADPDANGAPSAAIASSVSAWVARRFPRADPEPAALETCLYTTTPDESFVLERHGRVVVGSACSGHGFKFAPAVGERLATLATG
jgi:sarcosine oxidase